MADNKWKQPGQPPPPLFLGKKERDLVKQINDELVERVIGQQILYYPISIENRIDLQQAKSTEPIIWLWKDGEIKRIKDSLFLKVA